MRESSLHHILARMGCINVREIARQQHSGAERKVAGLCADDLGDIAVRAIEVGGPCWRAGRSQTLRYALRRAERIKKRALRPSSSPSNRDA